MYFRNMKLTKNVGMHTKRINTHLSICKLKHKQIIDRQLDKQRETYIDRNTQIDRQIDNLLSRDLI